MSTKKLLLVDDQEEIIEAIAELLELDYDEALIHTANSGAEALIKLSEVKYDVICTDFNMPGMSGAELLREVKNGEGLNINTDFIIITGDSNDIKDELVNYPDIKVVNKAENIPMLIKLIGSYLED